MKKSVNINSGQWCDLIFKDRNKAYGAYELRQTSSKRHILAFGIVVFLMFLIVLIPSLMNKVSASEKTFGEARDEVRTLIDMNKEEEKQVVDITQPEPPKINRLEVINSVRFTAPVIDEDENIPDDVEIKTVAEIMEDDRAIGYTDVDDGTDDVDAELLKEAAILTDEPTSTGDDFPDLIEVMPQFPGGPTELMKFIKDNLNYPVIDIELGRQGRVVLKFLVTEDGSIDRIKVLSGVSSTCDREAMRVVENMPNWIPGRQNGRPTAVYFTLPIQYRLKQ